MSEFKIHHHAAELLKLFGVTEGDGPEVYAELLTKDLTPYVTTQVSTHTAKRRIAEVSPAPQEFLKKYDELKSKNVRELDSLVYLLASIGQERYVVKFIERNEKDRSKQRELAAASRKSETPQTQLGKDLEAITKSIPKTTLMTQKDVQELKTKLANITTTATTSQNSTDDLVKALREKHSKKLGGKLPVLPTWTTERAYLTHDYVEAYRTNYAEPVAINTLPLKMQEITLVEDLLFMFMGVEGRYIGLKDEVEKKQYKSFVIDQTVDVSLHEIVNRILPMCGNYSIVCKFVEDGSRFEKGLVSHGLCSAIRSLLKDYFMFVAQLERQLRRGTLTLQKLWFYIQPSMKTLDILANVAIMIEKGHCKGAAILTLLHEKTESFTGDPKGRDLCLYLTQAACTAYFEILQRWIYEGVIKDPYEEFLVAEHESVQKERVTEDYNDQYWEQHYTIERERIPKFLERVAEKILRTGKYLNVIRQCGLSINCPHAQEIVYCLKERDYVDHIEKAYDYASRTLLDLLWTEKKLLYRLRSIKHYFLLDQGDFFVGFMDLAEDELKKNMDDIVPTRLEALLELAVRTSTANNDPFKDDLRCDLLPYDLISQLFRILSVTSDKNNPNYRDSTELQISGLEAFTLDYEVKWPLSLILSKKALTKYQMLFRHLFYAKHVERLLCHLWASNKEAKKHMLHKRPWYSIAFALRQRMIHFVQNFEYYMMFEVIEPCWHVLEDNLRSVSNIDGLLEFHNDFLDRCLKDCMLTSPELLKIVSKLMAVCVTFSNCILRYNMSTEVSQNSKSAAKVTVRQYDKMMSAEEIEKTISNFDTNFSRLLIELLDKLSVMSSTEKEQEMMNLVFRLDHNSYYSEFQRKQIADK
ncbi:gamma-tubulin complex component 2-like [Hydractinia symbiolongicarpus]|uniref:gamma-tubulin complex component 2-like n=1 Tax=Hydractinia symbiolongicarpus TaxID=13093 RepID=UPI00254BB29B|nr:gamma-tubulin complex component 2-like [Hydractinia symbiolongicarpus]